MPPVIKILTADEADFAQCFAVRLKVFVDEQRVPVAEERDDYDALAQHFLALQDGVALGTARVLMREDGAAKIGRVAVLPAARGRGIGLALMRAVEMELPLARLYVLNAQVRALRFYEKLGYAAEGEVFLEGGIPHRRMAKTPVR